MGFWQGEKRNKSKLWRFSSHTVKKFGKIVLLWEMSYFYFFFKKNNSMLYRRNIKQVISFDYTSDKGIRI